MLFFASFALLSCRPPFELQSEVLGQWSWQIQLLLGQWSGQVLEAKEVVRYKSPGAIFHVHLLCIAFINILQCVLIAGQHGAVCMAYGSLSLSCLVLRHRIAHVIRSPLGWTRARAVIVSASDTWYTACLFVHCFHWHNYMLSGACVACSTFAEA